MCRAAGAGPAGPAHARNGNWQVAASISSPAETTPLPHPEHYQYDFNLRDIAEVRRRGSVIASCRLDLIASGLVKARAFSQFAGRASDSGEGHWPSRAAGVGAKEGAKSDGDIQQS